MKINFRMNKTKIYIAIGIIVAFIVVNVLPSRVLEYLNKNKDVLAAYSAVLRTENRDMSYEKAKNQSIIGDGIDEILASVDKISEDITENDRDLAKKDLNILSENIKNINNSLDSQKDKNLKKIEKLNNNSAEEKLNEFTEQCKSELGNFNSKLATFVASLDTESDNNKILNDWNGIKDSIAGEKQEQTLGDTLPHSSVEYNEVEPESGEGIEPSYARSTLANSNNGISSEASDEDLKETDETPFTSEIIKLGDKLQEPQKIYEYVRNNIDFEPYSGSKKGAVGVLREKSGNDVDQASLLISLLRQQGYPSRYVEGTVQLPIEKVVNWIGAKTNEAAIKAFSSMGVPTKAIVNGGKIVGAQIQHTWVEVYIPYEYYRGEKTSSGKSIWVPLDPSFKQYKELEGLDIEEISGISVSDLEKNLNNNSEQSQDGYTITNVDNSKIQGKLDGAMEKIEQYIKDNKLEDKPLRSLIGGKEIIPEKLTLLPNSLPYKTIGVYKEYQEVYDEISEKIGFSISGQSSLSLNFGSDRDFYKEYKSVNLYGKRIILEWVAATKDDQKIIDEYGGMTKVPTYLVSVKPQLEIDGEVIAEGNPVRLGYRQQFTITMKHVGLEPQDIDNPLTIGGVYAVGLDYGTISSAELEGLQSEIGKLKDELSESNMYSGEGIGKILNSVAKTYFSQLDVYNQLIGQASNVNAHRLTSEGMTGFSPKVKYLFNTPVEIAGGSFFIDIDHDVQAVSSKSGEKADEIMYMTQAGIMGSAMENIIYEQNLQLPSVSTIKILQEANNRGIPIYTFSKANINRINELSVSQSIKTDVINAVNDGKTVTIPKTEIRYCDWEGSGYIVMDPNTGAAAYMISGGLAGGSAAIDIGVTLIALIDIAFALYDVVTMCMLAVAATNPIVFVLFYGLYIISFLTLLDTLYNIIMYWETGNYEYATSLMGDFILNFITLGIGKIIEKIAPSVVKLFKKVFNQMDDIAKISEKLGEKVSKAITSIDGEAALKEADEVIDALKGSGATDDIIESIAEKSGLKGLKTYEELLKSGLSEDAIEKAIKNGFDLNEVKALYEKGIKPDQYLEYGIKNSTEASWVNKYLSEGYDINDIKKLSEKGINPSSYASRGINSAEDAAKEALKEVTKAELGHDFGKMGKYVEHPNIEVDWSKFAEHGLERMEQRGITKEMVNDFVKNGKVLSQNEGNKFAFITKDGVAIVSKDGKLITTWGKDKFDDNMKEIVKMLWGE